MGSRPLGIRAAGPPRGWPANFQNPGCAQGVSAPPLHPPCLSPAPSLRYLQGDLSHMAVSRCQGLGSTLGTTSTPSPATVSKMPVLLRPAPPDHAQSHELGISGHTRASSKLSGCGWWRLPFLSEMSTFLPPAEPASGPQGQTPSCLAPLALRFPALAEARAKGFLRPCWKSLTPPPSRKQALWPK